LQKDVVVQAIGPRFGSLFAQMELAEMADQLFETGGTELALAASEAFMNVELRMRC
jgi:hypothetical protein